MTISVNSIISRAQILIQDTTGVRWPTTELLDWVNDGQREVCLFKPSVGAKNESLALVSGTKQAIPSSGLGLLRIVRNMTSAGAGARAVRIIDREVLDTQLPDWHSETPVANVKHYMFDDLDPTNYYVYPPNNSNGHLEVIYAATPLVVAAGGNISIPDVYANGLLDYVLFRAYGKDSDHAGNAERSGYHYQLFTTSLGMKTQADSFSSPNLQDATTQIA
jgi:hypothetical protein